MFKSDKMRSLKAQSAMEYLMTYGWAILIIAIVLVALFELGIFGGSSLPTACTGQSGFVCQNPVFANSNLVITVGEASGSSYTGANVFFLNSTALATFQANPTAIPAHAPQNDIGSMTTGATYPATLPVGWGPTIGSSVSGQLWLEYTNGGTSQFQELATLTAKYT